MLLVAGADAVLQQVDPVRCYAVMTGEVVPVDPFA